MSRYVLSRAHVAAFTRGFAAVGLTVLLTVGRPVYAQERDDGGGIAAIGNTFTYQGVLNQSGTPINGSCDLQFSLWSAAAGPTQIGSTQQFLAQSVTDGQLTLDLNFGAAFDGNDRWIEVAVRFPAGGGSYTTLTPRQKINAVPYALWSLGGAGGGGGLTLPYTATVSSASDLMTVTNTFTGGAGYSGRVGGANYGLVGKHNVTNNLGFVGHAGYGMFGIGEGATSIGVRGTHVPTGHDGELGDPNAGVQGLHIPTGNLGHLGTVDFGVYGFANTPSSWAMYGFNAIHNTSGRVGHTNSGVWGVAGSANGCVGVRGTHAPTGNYAELGTSNYGVEAHAANSESSALYAEYSGAIHARLATSNTGPVAGRVAVHAANWSLLGDAIFAETGAGAAVRGHLDSGNTFGALGIELDAFSAEAGVYGKSNSGYGVMAEGFIPLLAQRNSGVGNIAIFRLGSTNQARIDSSGRGFFNGGTQTGGADVAEAICVEGDVASYETGDVLVISTLSDRTVTKSHEPYSTLAAGVYATKPGVLLTDAHIDDPLTGTIPVGVVGIIPTKVSAENGPIQRGDLLVTSSVPGHAMKGTDRDRMLGAIIGKALENFDGANGPSTGVIKAMVNVK